MMRLFFPNARQRYLRSSLLCAALFSPAAAAQLGISTVAASDYVVQGISQTRGEASLQAGASYGLRDTGLYGGVWLAESRLLSKTVREVDYYLGWRMPVDGGGDWTTTLTHYSYPDQPDYLDYNYNELAVAWQAGNGFSSTLGINDSFYSRNRKSGFAEVAYEFAVSGKVLLSGGLGYHDTEKLFGRDYRYWHLGLARVTDRFTVDLSLIGTDDNAEDIFGDRAGRRWVLSFVAKVF
jgi:uncharacterized protein (TIGR02001 family)